MKVFQWEQQGMRCLLSLENDQIQISIERIGPLGMVRIAGIDEGAFNLSDEIGEIINRMNKRKGIFSPEDGDSTASLLVGGRRS